MSFDRNSLNLLRQKVVQSNYNQDQKRTLTMPEKDNNPDKLVRKFWLPLMSQDFKISDVASALSEYNTDIFFDQNFLDFLGGNFEVEMNSRGETKTIKPLSNKNIISLLELIWDNARVASVFQNLTTHRFCLMKFTTTVNEAEQSDQFSVIKNFLGNGTPFNNNEKLVKWRRDFLKTIQPNILEKVLEDLKQNLQPKYSSTKLLKMMTQQLKEVIEEIKKPPKAQDLVKSSTKYLQHENVVGKKRTADKISPIEINELIESEEDIQLSRKPKKARTQTEKQIATPHMMIDLTAEDKTMTTTTTTIMKTTTTTTTNTSMEPESYLFGNGPNFFTSQSPADNAVRSMPQVELTQETYSGVQSDFFRKTFNVAKKLVYVTHPKYDNTQTQSDNSTLPESAEITQETYSVIQSDTFRNIFNLKTKRLYYVTHPEYVNTQAELDNQTHPESAEIAQEMNSQYR